MLKGEGKGEVGELKLSNVTGMGRIRVRKGNLNYQKLMAKEG